ncbi:hypothetical protein [Parasediminibacterium sp. JCM 36343]|uniref:hypothetical protein n=1 Tax=Parasediminibacterium sp. JCM 36343 TaxID=3374279 RepID=UPI00397A2900
MSVDGWVMLFEKLGLSVLYTKHSRGRKAILSNVDLGIARYAVVEERQRLSQAKLLIEQGLGIQFKVNERGQLRAGGYKRAMGVF